MKINLHTVLFSAMLSVLSAQTHAQTFTQVGPMLHGRDGNTAILLQDGTVLIAGGSEIPVEEIYTPGVGFAQTLGQLHNPRAEAFGFLASNGTAAIVGGKINGTVSPVLTIETYNPLSQTFTIAQNLPNPVDTAIQLMDGTILIFYSGSSSTSIYDPVAGSLTAGPADIASSTGRYAFRRPDGSVLVIVPGQLPRSYTQSSTGGSIASFGSIIQSSSIPVDAVGTFLGNGNVLFSGGRSNPITGTSATEIWSPTGGISPGPTMNSPRYLHTAIGLTDGTAITYLTHKAIGRRFEEWNFLTHFSKPSFTSLTRIARFNTRST